MLTIEYLPSFKMKKIVYTNIKTLCDLNFLYCNTLTISIYIYIESLNINYGQ